MLILNPQMDEGDHPTEDALERYLLQRMLEHDIERIETHVLCCDSCLDKLEALDVYVKAVKLALRASMAQEADTSHPTSATQRGWSLFPRLSWVAVAALIALCLSVPNISRQNPEVTLTAYRGSNEPVIPQHRSTPLVIEALDVPDGIVLAQVIDLYGTQVWTARTAVHNRQVRVLLPGLDKDGSFFLRLYGLSVGHDGPTLLRELAFRVQ